MSESAKGPGMIGIMSKGMALTAWIIGLNLAVLMQLGLLAPPQKMFVVDAGAVARAFLEGRGAAMSDEELAAAILVFDSLVMAEAQALHQQSGVILVNKSHVLAGAEDVSGTFAGRVLARWDALDGQ